RPPEADVKSCGVTTSGQWKLSSWSAEEESGIPRVAVKCVEMWRNTSGEGDSLVCNWRWGAKAWGANRIRYPGSPRRKRWVLGVGPFHGFCAVANALSTPPGEYGRKAKTQRN